VSLPGLGLGHHLGDQIPAQPHLPRLPPSAARATLAGAGGLVDKGSAHPLIGGPQPLFGDRLGRPHGVGGGRFLTASALRRMVAVRSHGVVVQPVVPVELCLLGFRQLPVGLDVGSILDQGALMWDLDLVVDLPGLSQRHKRGPQPEQAGPYHRPLWPVGLAVQVDVGDLTQPVAVAVDHDPAQPSPDLVNIGSWHRGSSFWLRRWRVGGAKRLRRPDGTAPCGVRFQNSRSIRRSSTQPADHSRRLPRRKRRQEPGRYNPPRQAGQTAPPGW
jgi:hypothetical protein